MSLACFLPNRHNGAHQPLRGCAQSQPRAQPCAHILFISDSLSCSCQALVLQQQGWLPGAMFTHVCVYTTPKALPREYWQGAHASLVIRDDGRTAVIATAPHWTNSTM
jgi:hypothetical protein